MVVVGLLLVIEFVGLVGVTGLIIMPAHLIHSGANMDASDSVHGGTCTYLGNVDIVILHSALDMP